MRAPKTSAQANGSCAPEEARHPPQPDRDHSRRDDDAERRHEADRPGPAAQQREVDVKRAREEQEGQHAVQDGALEVDAPQELGQAAGQRDLRQRELDPDQHQRGDEPHDEEPDRVRKADQDMVEPAERGREHEQDGDQVEDGRHGELPGSGRGASDAAYGHAR